MAMIILLLGSTLSQISPSVSFCKSNGGLTPTIISLSPDPPRLGNQQFFINATVENPGIAANVMQIFGDLSSSVVTTIINPNVTVGQYNLYYSQPFQLYTSSSITPGTYPTTALISDTQGNNDLCVEYNITIPEPKSNGGSSCFVNIQGYVFAYNYTFSTNAQNLFTVNINIMIGIQGFSNIQMAIIDLYSIKGSYISNYTYPVNIANSNAGDFNNFTFIMPILPSEPGVYYYTIKLTNEYYE